MAEKQDMRFVRNDTQKVAIEQSSNKRARHEQDQQENTQKPKPKTNRTTSETLDEIDAQILSLQNTRRVIATRVEEKFATKWIDVSSSADTLSYLRIHNVKQSDWECSICTTSFLPMKLADINASIDDHCYRCEQCGVPVCWRCIFTCIENNSSSTDHASIGVPCAFCQAYNCNRIKDLEPDSKKPLSAFPFPSGYSSFEPAKVKGVKLPTSCAVTCGNTKHTKNSAKQRERYEVQIIQDAESSYSSSSGDDDVEIIGQ